MLRLVYSVIVIGSAFLSCTGSKKEKVFTMKTLASPSGDNASLPFLFSNSKTTLLSWVEQIDDSLALLRYSELHEDKWKSPENIVDGTDWFVNWADFPAIAENNGHLFSHVLQKSTAGTYSYDVRLNLKSADAANWKTYLPLHTDGTPTEHGFVTALPYQNDSFFVTWLDGRNTEEQEGRERGAMTIRSAEVSIQGKIENEIVLDSRTCDCCQTSAAITENGPVVLYRDRTRNEIRDISIVRQVNGIWTSPTAVHDDHWKINGCPVNGPKAISLENMLAVTWFTGAGNVSTVKIAFSDDNGAHFDTPISIGSNKVLGRVDVILLDKQTALVSFMESNDNSTRLKAIKIHRSGKVSEERVITEISASRKTGFPQMELVGDRVLFAWTDSDTVNSTIKTTYASIDSF